MGLSDDAVVKVELGTPGLLLANGATRSWVDVTADAIEIACSRGRQDELDKFEAGTCTVRLRDNAGDYDPSAAPLHGKALRITATYNGTTYPVWQGFVHDQQPSKRGLSVGVTTIVAADLLSWLARLQYRGDGFTLSDGLDVGQIIYYTLASSVIGAAPYPALVSVDDAFVATIDAGGYYEVPASPWAAWLWLDRELVPFPIEIVHGTKTSGGPLSFWQEAATADQGRLYVNAYGAIVYATRYRTYLAASSATFGEDIAGGDVPISEGGLEPRADLTRLRNIVEVTPEGGTPVQVFDQASVDQYGPYPYSVTLPFNVPADAALLAGALLNRYAQPRTRVGSLQISGRLMPTRTWTQVMEREIGDRVTIARVPAGLSASPAEYTIERVEHSISRRSGAFRWDTTYGLAPLEYSGVFILDDDVYGILDAGWSLAY